MSTNGHTELTAGKNLFRIGEVSRLTDTKPFVLRYWETEFPMLQPVKSPKGHRLYRREDVETVRVIKHLLYDEGFTIAGARRHLNEAGGTPQEMASVNFGEAEAAELDAVEPSTDEVDVADFSDDELQGAHEGAHGSHQIDQPSARMETRARAEATTGGAMGLLSKDLVSQHPAPVAASSLIDRNALLELRDSLRALLTLLESE